MLLHECQHRVQLNVGELLPVRASAVEDCLDDEVGSVRMVHDCLHLSFWCKHQVLVGKLVKSHLVNVAVNCSVRVRALVWPWGSLLLHSLKLFLQGSKVSFWVSPVAKRNQALFVQLAVVLNRPLHDAYTILEGLYALVLRVYFLIFGPDFSQLLLISFGTLLGFG